MNAPQGRSEDDLSPAEKEWRAKTATVARELMDAAHAAAGLIHQHSEALQQGRVTWELAQAKRRAEEQAHAALNRYLNQVARLNL